jgi:CelD/BcsL family acetyltransferase involved in cellulose biosynthesis
MVVQASRAGHDGIPSTSLITPRVGAADPRSVAGLVSAWGGARLSSPPIRGSVRLDPVVTREEWDALASQHGGTFFHRYDFLATMAVGLGVHLDLRRAVLGRRTAGVVPMLIRRRGPLTVVNRLPFPYIGPLVRPDAHEPTMAALARHEQLIGCLRSKYDLTEAHRAAVPGYVREEESTYVVPVEGRSDEELLHGMSSRRRASMRRAERKGLTVRPATMPEVTQLMPRLFAATLAKQGLRPLYSAALFDLAWEQFTGNPDVLLQAAEFDGTTVAVQISLAGAPTGLAWVVGRRQDQDGSDAYAAMMWRTMCWARDRGCQEFDLVGAPTEGIANYKRGLGAQERRYAAYSYEARGYRVVRDLAAWMSRSEQPSDGSASAARAG